MSTQTTYEKVKAFMKDGEWHTLQDISDGTGLPIGSDIGRRVRQLRQHGYTVDRKIQGGVWRYRIKTGTAPTPSSARPETPSPALPSYFK